MSDQMEQLEIDDDHPLKTNIVQPLFETLEDFKKLKSLLEDCIDIGKAR